MYDLEKNGIIGYNYLLEGDWHMTIIGIILAIILIMLLGELGIFILVAIMFGLVFSTYIKNKVIYEEVEQIKEALSTKDKDEQKPVVGDKFNHEISQNNSNP